MSAYKTALNEFPTSWVFQPVVFDTRDESCCIQAPFDTCPYLSLLVLTWLSCVFFASLIVPQSKPCRLEHCSGFVLWITCSYWSADLFTYSHLPPLSVCLSVCFDMLSKRHLNTLCVVPWLLWLTITFTDWYDCVSSWICIPYLHPILFVKNSWNTVYYSSCTHWWLLNNLSPYLIPLY